MSEKNIPVYLGEEGDTSKQIGWASEEVDGGRALNLNEGVESGEFTSVWFGEPDPNAPVEEVEESESEVNEQPEPVDAAPVEVPDTKPPVSKKK